MSKLPIGDKTLSAKEIIANESQERMGLLIDEQHIEHVRRIAERERAPLYVVGETTGDAHFSFEQATLPLLTIMFRKHCKSIPLLLRPMQTRLS